MYDWINKHIERGLTHFGRTTEPKREMANDAWYKDYTYGYPNSNTHYFVNDLLGQRIPITEQQYDDENYTTPN